MKKELDDKLCADFPKLYKNRNGNPAETAMYWGFECGNGWESIIRKLSERLTKLSELEKVDVVATQVKEKFGTLRFYTNVETDLMSACIELAEAQSESICEVCGEIGRLVGESWVKTLCEKCEVPAETK